MVMLLFFSINVSEMCINLVSVYQIKVAGGEPRCGELLQRGPDVCGGLHSTC